MFQSLVVDDLDAPPFLHALDDQLADDAVGKCVVAGLDLCQVVEETGGPEALEILED